MALILFLANSQPSKQTSYDLLSDYDWSHLAGAAQTTNNVDFSPLDRQIVNQDGTGGQPNPPVNLAGPVINFDGDFDLSANVKNFEEGDSLSLYGGVPIVYDEWRYEPPSIKIINKGLALELDIFNGKSSDPQSVSLERDSSAIKSIHFQRSGQSLAIYTNGKFLGSINPANLFKSNHLRIGAEASGSNWQLESLKLSGDSSKIKVTKGLDFNKSDANTASLQQLAKQNNHKLKIGAAVALNPLLTDTKYRELALNQFGIWTPENELKPQFIHPKQNTYSFNEADLLVNTAFRNNTSIHGHALVFGEANPKWMQNSQSSHLQSIMTDHISETINHFKDRIHEWDVINEPLSDEDMDFNGDGLRKHLWYKAMGEQYIPIALDAAHQADPSADLYINDYGLEADGQRWEAFIKLIKNLQDQGTPLSGIGFEAHIYDPGDEINPATLTSHFKQLADMDLKVRVSEIDVHGENQRIQKQQYAAVLKVCLAAPNCVAFSSWGISDKYGSTTEINSYPLSYGNDLLWDKGFNAKPAYFELAKILRSQ